MNKHLHIICLNIPYPVDYGGVVDLFYKLPVLQQQGIKIHLHCFKYGRAEQAELNKYCETVDYYSRDTSVLSLSSKYPYIVSSRSSKSLIQSLLGDDYPILMEGVHCTYLLNDSRFKNRKCFVRLHNVEFVYYKHLFQFTNSLFKKVYFNWESQQLEKYEKKIAPKATFLPVAKKDGELYQELGCKNVVYLPVFLPDWTLSTIEGKGTFCLYQGDLSVPENEKAATWLLEQVFANLTIPFVIAGNNPSKKLQKLVAPKNNICLIANPDETEMQDLIAKSHINIIPSYNATGVKLKLINALYNGRHCIVNEATVTGSGLEAACHIVQEASEFITAIENLYNRPFTTEEMETRHYLLDTLFDNNTNAKQLIDIIWKEE